MRFLLRWSFNGAAAASAALCVAACILWVRSYQVSDRLYSSHWWLRGLVGNESAWWLLTGRGGVGIGHRVQEATQSPSQIAAFTPLVNNPESSWKQERPATPLYPQDGEGIIRQMGFRYEDDPMPAAFAGSVSGYYREWDVPLWFVGLLLAVLPVSQFFAARKRRRSAKGVARNAGSTCVPRRKDAPSAERCPRPMVRHEAILWHRDITTPTAACDRS
jgi:hypothetical protein